MKKFFSIFTNLSERTLRIGGASILALLFIGTAYVTSGPTFLSEKFAKAGTTDDLLKAYAAKDSDGDGLPDWEEALYGTDPNKAISNPYGIPDGEAAREGKLTPTALASQLPSSDQGTTTASLIDSNTPGSTPAPGSITEQFSQQFLDQIVQADNGQPMDDDTRQKLIDSFMTSITQQVSQSLTSSYAPVAVHTSINLSVSDYATSVETVLTQNDLPDEENQPYALMQSLILNNDTSAGKKLLDIANAYAAMATQLRAVSVPTQLVNSHVALVQSLDTLSRSTAIIANYQKDPLGTMAALSVFNTATKQFSDALNQLATSILANGEPQEGSPGYLIVSIARLSSS